MSLICKYVSSSKKQMIVPSVPTGHRDYSDLIRSFGRLASNFHMRLSKEVCCFISMSLVVFAVAQARFDAELWALT